jgi:hypothetical protein
MNEFLAQHYGTGSEINKEAAAQEQEELAHQEQLEYFAKVASANGIDLNQLNQDQVTGLWNEVFSKVAEDGDGDEDDDDE